MRVTHVITGLNRGGAEHSLFRLIRAQGNPAQHSVISLLDGGIYRPRIEELGVRVTSLGMKRSLPSLPALLRLRRLIQERQPDLVQTWMYHADLLAAISTRFLDIPVCWGIHNTRLDPVNTKYSTRLVVRLCALLSDRVPEVIVSCSVESVRSCQEYGYRARFKVVHNGIDPQEWHLPPSKASKVREELRIPVGVLIGHAGRNDPQKDHPNLALGFNLVHHRHPHARLLLCGDHLADGSSYFRQLPFVPAARHAVLALGPRDDLPRLWQMLDIFVLSSSFGEAFPNVLLEAMAAGVPCVTTDVGDAAEIVGDTGLVVPPGQPEALAAAIEKLIALGPEGRRALGEAARARVAERYTLEKMVQGYQEAWSEVLQARRKT